jgi:hypothetical protein
MDIPSYLYVVAGVVWLVVILVYVAAPSHREAVKFSALAAGFILALLQLQAAMLQARGTMLQVRHAAIESRENVQHRRLDVAFVLIGEWNKPDVTDAVVVLEPLVKAASGRSPSEILQVLRENKRNDPAFRKVFDLFENIGLAVQTGYADDATLCLYFKKAVEHYYGTFDDYVRAQRLKYEDAYVQFEWLYRHWRDHCAVPQLSPTTPDTTG